MKKYIKLISGRFVSEKYGVSDMCYCNGKEIFVEVDYAGIFTEEQVTGLEQQGKAVVLVEHYVTPEKLVLVPRNVDPKNLTFGLSFAYSSTTGFPYDHPIAIWDAPKK